MEEIWKDIEGFEGLYQISDLGNVRSLQYAGRNEIRNLVPKKNNSGRLWVELWKNRQRHCFLIHRLVGFAFIPNPNCYPQINHIDENPENNAVYNLEWCTALYNVREYCKNHPERRAKRKSTTKYNKHMNKPVLQLHKDGEIVFNWDNPISAANANGWNEWSIIQCCNGIRKTAYGYIWQYADQYIHPEKDVK